MALYAKKSYFLEQFCFLVFAGERIHVTSLAKISTLSTHLKDFGLIRHSLECQTANKLPGLEGPDVVSRLGRVQEARLCSEKTAVLSPEILLSLS